MPKLRTRVATLRFNYSYDENRYLQPNRYHLDTQISKIDTKVPCKLLPGPLPMSPNLELFHNFWSRAVWVSDQSIEGKLYFPRFWFLTRVSYQIIFCISCRKLLTILFYKIHFVERIKNCFKPCLSHGEIIYMSWQSFLTLVFIQD